MNDQEFLTALERCDLPPSQFDHAAHLRAGYLYLRAHGFGAAIERMSTAVRRYADRHGAPDKYHETMTVAWMALIRQHMTERGDAGSWPAFRSANQDLLAPGVLERYYDPAVLASALARRTFVLPLRTRMGAVLLCAGLILALASAGTIARECRGVAFPERIQVPGAELVLNGLGVRKATFLRINVYVAALYVSHPATSAEVLLADPGPQQLTLRFLRNVGVSDLSRAWREGFERAASSRLPALQTRIDTLSGWMSDMRTGEQMRLMWFPGRGVQVEVGGNVRGTIPGEDFARALMSIFIGPTPPNPELKTGLLGGPCS